MSIKFLEITNTNVINVCCLDVFEHQKSFVAPNAVSLSEAFASRNENKFAMPFGIYDGDTLIGFIMFGFDTVSDPYGPEIAKENYVLWRLMIDKKYQGRGYGKPVLRKAIEYLRTFPAGKANYVWLSYEKENVSARNMYLSFGFEENGQFCGEEIAAVYDLR